MKVIPLKELIAMLESIPPRNITKTEICNLFDRYGDDYYKESSWADYELSSENELRKKFFE